MVATKHSYSIGRVLVVEDDAALRNVLRFNLEGVGFEVVVRNNGLEGWNFLQQVPVDMVVTDLQMPKMTGIELCQTMRADERFAGLPVLLLTARGFDFDAERLRSDLRAVDIVFKPFSPKALVRCVARHIRAGEFR